jgi:hypothetical protein
MDDRAAGAASQLETTEKALEQMWSEATVEINAINPREWLGVLYQTHGRFSHMDRSHFFSYSLFACVRACVTSDHPSILSSTLAE